MAFYAERTPLDHGKLERGARLQCRLSKKCFSIGSVCVDVVTVPNVGNCIKVYVLCKKIPAVVAFGIKLPQFSNLFINFDVYCL